MYISVWLGGGGRPQVMQKSDMHVGIPLYGQNSARLVSWANQKQKCADLFMVISKRTSM